MYSSAAFATITESLRTKGKKKIPNAKTFPSCRGVVRRHLASIHDPRGNGRASPPRSPKRFYLNLKKGKGSKRGEIKTINSCLKGKRAWCECSICICNKRPSKKGLRSSRCLLTALVNRLKGNLKRVQFLICLTPLACRSGQTSSMLGGAQFKATLLDRKALLSNIQCKMTDSNSCQNRGDGKQLSAASDINGGLPLPAHKSGQRPLWAENAQCCGKSIDPTKLQNCQFMHVKWFSVVSLKPKSTPYAYTAQQHWHPPDFPHARVEHRSRPPSELVKFLKVLGGKSKSISQQAELRISRPHRPTSDLLCTSGTGQRC